MELFKDWFDVIFLISFLAGYFYTAFFRKSKEVFMFLILCIVWSTAGVWIRFIPNSDHLFSDVSSSFPGSFIPLGGLIYGIPLVIVTLVTLFVKRKIERK